MLRVIATASFWKSRSSFTSGLLDRSTEAQPLNAASPSAPVTPLIITTEPLSRASALAVSGACNRSGASILISAGMFCRSIGAAGGVALSSNFSGWPSLRALPVSLILRSESMVMSALTVSILRSTRSRRLENTMVPPVTLMCSIEKASVALPAAGLRGGIGLPHALASQRQIHHRTDDDELGDMRPACPQARERHVRLDACGREAGG